MSDQRSWGLLLRLNTKRVQLSWICDKVTFQKAADSCANAERTISVTEEREHLYTRDLPSAIIIMSRVQIESFIVLTNC